MAGINPLRHYLESGWREGRDPHPIFNADQFVKQYPQSAAINPLIHYFAKIEPAGRTATSKGPRKTQEYTTRLALLEKLALVVNKNNASFCI